jgi:protein-S-isoprenylcysteine O-methyltransferase Ste14
VLKPAAVFISFVAVALYLGLAVLGWGGFAAFFAHPARVAVAIITFALALAAIFTSGNLSAGEREDRSNRWVIGVFAVIGLMLGYVPAYTDRIDLWTIDGDTVRWIGVALYAAGGALRIWPVFVLGHRFSGLVAIQSGHQLVTTAVYRAIRHPSYLGLIINAVGWALAFRSGLGLLLAVSLVVPLLARIRAEERLLHAQFGDEYDAYRRRTWRLIPGLY